MGLQRTVEEFRATSWSSAETLWAKLSRQFQEDQNQNADRKGVSKDSVHRNQMGTRVLQRTEQEIYFILPISWSFKWIWSQKHQSNLFCEGNSGCYNHVHSDNSEPKPEQNYVKYIQFRSIIFDGVDFIDADSETFKEVPTLNRNLRLLTLIGKVCVFGGWWDTSPWSPRWNWNLLERLSLGKIIPLTCKRDWPAASLPQDIKNNR